VIIDAHTHIWRRWPHEPKVPDQETRASVANLLFEMDRSGVDKAVIVSARLPGSSDNNAYGAAAVAAHPDRFVQFVDVDSRWSSDYHTPGAATRLERVAERYAPAGVSHYLRPDNDGWLTSEGGRAFFGVAEERRLIVSVGATPAWLRDLSIMAGAFPASIVLVNHLAGVTLWPEGEDEGLAVALAAESVPNLLVKVSGFYYGHQRPWDYPYVDRAKIVRAFYDKWGPERMVWGSDFPAVLTHMSYRQSLELVREHAPVPGPELKGVLGETMWWALNRRGWR
jgi:predicted TIM-barrel fold metal-dependent hydrolase